MKTFDDLSPEQQYVMLKAAATAFGSAFGKAIGDLAKDAFHPVPKYRIAYQPGGVLSIVDATGMSAPLSNLSYRKAMKLLEVLNETD